MHTFHFSKLSIVISIILVLLITGCNAKSGSEAKRPADTAGKQENTDFLYTNTTYGFNLVFPATWKDLKYREALVDYGNDIKAPVVYFGLPDQADIFAVGIYSQEQWDGLTKIEGPDGKEGATPLAKNNVYLFDYSVGHYAANEEMQERRTEISGIMDTFKVFDLTN